MSSSVFVTIGIFLCSIADEIIESQNAIKVKTEELKIKNAELQSKSKELQNVLKTSQEQLLTDTSIPLDLINQLATMVKDMKSAYQNDLNNLLNKFNDVHDQFVKQQELLVHQSKNSDNSDKDKDKSSTINVQEKSEVPKICDKKITTTGREDVNNAWKKETKDMKPLTVLKEKEETDPDVPSTDSPASQSEVVTAAFLAQLTKNVTPPSASPASR